MKKPFEPALVYTPEHKNTWMYVGHIFQMPFYVFTYAFAQLCSLALFQQYREQGSEFVEKYFEVLKAGGSLSPKDNLIRVGLDVNDPEFWQAGLKLIESFVDELEELANSIQ
jgi:oligoendopeptidase F